MGRRPSAESYFRKRLRTERLSREWSQARMAQLLSTKGIDVHPTTIAKLEAGDRSARIDEVAAIADLLGVSIDTLLGRSTAPKNDRLYTFRALADAARQASWQIPIIESTLRDRVTELAAFGPNGLMKSTATRCERACDALAEAAKALGEALNPPGSEAAQRSLDKLFLKWVKEDLADEAQS
ncbi:helix-turn-helix domain-containing protein [Mycobacterium sp. pUA109]|uniref:helix-turn-helix domain-containing protein n=1 Tax=Mycobacterium sp. pUA109 TaxID=3238982 RepID=UPI00351B5DEF